MSRATSKGKIYFEHIDVIRFVAALLILILHTYEAWNGWYTDFHMEYSGLLGKLLDEGGGINQLVKNAGIGVDIFFLISGFLITYLLLEEKKHTGTIHIGKFFLRRSLRIWPVYFLLIIVSPFLVSWLNTSSPNYIYNCFFLGNFDIINTESWQFPFAHFWTICIEEHFYLVWPFIIYLFPVKKLLYAFGCLFLMSICFRLWAYSSMEYSWFTLHVHTLSRIDVLILGAVGGFYYSQKPFEFRLNWIIRWLLFALLIFILSITPLYEWKSLFSAGFKKYLSIGILTILLLDFNFNKHLKHILPAKSVIHYLGKISYGLYMYGNILLLLIIEKIVWRIGTINFWGFLFIKLFITIIVSILSYELFEKRVLKINRRLRSVNVDR